MTKLLTVEEAAAACRVHPATLRRWLAEGKLEAVRPGGPRGSIRIREDALARWLARSSTVPTMSPS
jgi:excisionase family DNA binding protein